MEEVADEDGRAGVAGAPTLDPWLMLALPTPLEDHQLSW